MERNLGGINMVKVKRIKDYIIKTLSKNNHPNRLNHLDIIKRL